MARLLVTGGAGFIGANFVPYWLERHPGERLVVVDALTYAGDLRSLEAVAGRSEFRFVHGDIRDQGLVEKLLVDEELDTIVHLAAETHVDRSISNPGSFFAVNVLGTHSLLQAARSAWLRADRPVDHRFHHVSTDEVYGDLDLEDPPFSETKSYAPNSPYAASKAGADHAVRAYWRTFGLRVTISNCSNNYGPFQHPEKLIPLAIVRLLEGRQIPIYGDGTNVRDWIHVTDHCRGIEQVLERGEEGRIYNLGGRCERTNLSLVEELCNRTDEAFALDPALRRRFPKAWPAQGASCREAVTFVADRAAHDRRYAIDPGRAHEELGFRAEVDFEQGLRRTLCWYLDNETWWTSMVNGFNSNWSEPLRGGI